MQKRLLSPERSCFRIFIRASGHDTAPSSSELRCFFAVLSGGVRQALPSLLLTLIWPFPGARATLCLCLVHALTEILLRM